MVCPLSSELKVSCEIWHYQSLGEHVWFVKLVDSLAWCMDKNTVSESLANRLAYYRRGIWCNRKWARWLSLLCRYTRRWGFHGSQSLREALERRKESENAFIEKYISYQNKI